VAVVPPLSVQLTEQVLLFPDETPKAVTVRVKNNTAKVDGALKMEAPAGWKIEPAAIAFPLGEDGEAEFQFQVTPPAGEAQALLRAKACVGAKECPWEVKVIRYANLAPQTVLVRAEARLVRADVRTLARKIGYIVGAGDRVPEALRQIGCEVTLLRAEDLFVTDLGRFDAVIAGVRAFNVHPELRQIRERLLNYMHTGGTWLVQYNVADGRSPEAVADVGPYPIRLGRNRVTDPAAPVTVLDAAHPLLDAPNRICEDDFRGWVQERGLYFAAEWDARYTALVECHDEGEEPLAGAILYTPYGRGAYVFTAFSWFRQLPAGVPGAYRVFANLLSAAKLAG
jgi:hypothetical protein